ncbi:MAG: CoA pyrophosphatase [Bacteroidetes bacterium CG_4_10_14_3_um_filter_31_20]|nr:MAG: CoA pyrophosphatase [Bacteroidetes bacterium CG_4_10_14_3_um_filter_31_20]
MDFIEQLRNELQKPLPGIEVQLEMASGNRLFYKEFKNPKTPKTGAVLIPLYFENNKPHIILIKRTTDNGPHSGQMAFPGGMFENGDITLYKTAIREAFEEIGIFEKNIELVGKLTPLHIPVSNIIVHPFVALLKQKPEIIISRDEVESVLQTPVDVFFEEKNRSYFNFEYDNKKYKSPCFLINGFTIWGATAMIWNEFLTIYKNATNNKP